MAGEEGGHLGLVLLGEQRTGSVDQTSAGANQGRGLIEDRRLLGQKFGKVGLGEAQPRVGIAPPGAGAGAGRIDQHAVEGVGAALDPLVAGFQQVALDVVHAGAAEAAHRALQPRRRDVARDQLAAVLHRHRQRQRLAAGAGAQVGHAQAGPGIDQRGDELAALVLDLHQAGAEGWAGGDLAAALDPQAPGGMRRRRGVQALGGERGAGFLAGGLQQVDAKIERRRFQQSAQFGAVDAWRQPVRHFQPHRVGHRRMVERAALEAPQRRLLGRRQRSRGEAAAGERVGHIRVAAAIEQQRCGDQQAGRRAIAQPPGQAAAGAQHAPDVARHRAPVARTDEPPGAEEVVGHGVGGTWGDPPPPLAGWGWGEGAPGHWRDPLPPTPSRKGRGRLRL